MPSASIFLIRRLGELLDRRRVLLFSAVFLAIEVAGFAFVTSGACLVCTEYTAADTDFVSFYAAGSLADAGAPQLAYEPAAHHAAEVDAVHAGVDHKYFYYPPVFLLLCALLARLPFAVGFGVFEGATLILYALVARAILADKDWRVLAPVLAFPVLFINLSLGQNALLTASLFGAATLLLDRRPAVAGLLLGMLCYKPHFGLLVPIALAAGGRWRAFAAAFATMAGLCLLSLAAFGWTTWQAFLSYAFTSAHTTYESGVVPLGTYVSPFGAVLVLGGSRAAGYAVQAAATLAAAALVACAWRRRLPLAVKAATLLSATLVALPVIFIYDLLGVLAVLWLVRPDGARIPGWARIALAGCFLLLPCWRTLSAWHLPIVPLTGLIVVVLSAASVFGDGAPGWRRAAVPAL